MSGPCRADGFVLRSVKHGESSLILTVFTREYGRIGLMAKGARGTKRRTQAAFELFTEAQYVFLYKPSRSLQLLKESAVLHPHLKLRDDLKLMIVGSAVAELLLRCLREEDPHEDLYDAVRTIYAALNDQPADPLPLLWQFELKLLQSLGYRIETSSCAVTSKSLASPPARKIRYRLSDGAFFHPDARLISDPDGQMSMTAFAALRNLAGGSSGLASRMVLKHETHEEIRLFLERFIESHLSLRGNLRSLDALSWSQP